MEKVDREGVGGKDLFKQNHNFQRSSYGRFAAGWRWGGLRWGHEDRVGVNFFYTNPSLPETSFSHQNL